MMKKLFAIVFALVALSACKNMGQGMNGSWLDGDRSSTTGDQTNAVNVVFFAFDSSKIDAEAKAKLVKQVEMWNTSSNKPALLVEGHCDERGTVEYNLALGERRAYAAKKELIALGIPAEKIETISYGKERPAVMGNDEYSWALNRRAVTIAVKN
ncbi:MAG: OmpA family protein [Pseudomonadota bacterium]